LKILKKIQKKMGSVAVGRFCMSNIARGCPAEFVGSTEKGFKKEVNSS
jgi:hypothetical protein